MWIFFPQKYEKPKFMLSLAFASSGDVITGDSNGNIYIWGKGEFTQSFHISTSQCTTVFLCIKWINSLLKENETLIFSVIVLIKS